MPKSPKTCVHFRFSDSNFV